MLASACLVWPVLEGANLHIKEYLAPAFSWLFDRMGPTSPPITVCDPPPCSSGWTSGAVAYSQFSQSPPLITSRGQLVVGHASVACLLLLKFHEVGVCRLGGLLQSRLP